MKFALCNEMFESRLARASQRSAASQSSMAEVCLVAGRLGYHGIEIAPFTLAPSAADVTSQRRKDVRQTVAAHGLEVVGLHWLFVGPTGLHMTTPDDAVWRKTRDYLSCLLDLCNDLGGKVLVVGSPKQRNILPGQTFDGAWKRAVDLFAAVLEKVAQLDVTLCIEPLSPQETDFINTVEQGLKMIREINHPSFKLHLDVKAMCSEQKSVAEIIRSVRAEDIGHFHVNDPNLYGPGMGDVDYGPVAEAIRDIGYDKWLSVEVFKYDPDPETIARRSIEYLRSYF